MEVRIHGNQWLQTPGQDPAANTEIGEEVGREHRLISPVHQVLCVSANSYENRRPAPHSGRGTPEPLTRVGNTGTGENIHPKHSWRARQGVLSLKPTSTYTVYMISKYLIFRL